MAILIIQYNYKVWEEQLYLRMCEQLSNRLENLFKNNKK